MYFVLCKEHYSSFWSSVKVTALNFFHHIGLGDENSRRKCYKFDNSSAFKSLPENCDTRLGFICEKPLLQNEGLYYHKNKVYFVQPRQNVYKISFLGANKNLTKPDFSSAANERMRCARNEECL